MHKFIRAYDDQPTIPANDDRKRILSTISELTPRLDPETLRVCASILASSIEPDRKIVTEEHGAGHIAGALSFLNGNDIAIARWTSAVSRPASLVTEAKWCGYRHRARAHGRKNPEQVAVAVVKDRSGKRHRTALGWTMITSAEPPTMAISIGLGRHSLKAVRESGAFVLSFPSAVMEEDTLFFGTTQGATETSRRSEESRPSRQVRSAASC